MSKFREWIPFVVFMAVAMAVLIFANPDEEIGDWLMAFAPIGLIFPLAFWKRGRDLAIQHTKATRALGAALIVIPILVMFVAFDANVISLKFATFLAVALFFLGLIVFMWPTICRRAIDAEQRLAALPTGSAIPAKNSLVRDSYLFVRKEWRAALIIIGPWLVICLAVTVGGLWGIASLDLKSMGKGAAAAALFGILAAVVLTQGAQLIVGIAWVRYTDRQERPPVLALPDKVFLRTIFWVWVALYTIHNALGSIEKPILSALGSDQEFLAAQLASLIVNSAILIAGSTFLPSVAASALGGVGRDAWPSIVKRQRKRYLAEFLLVCAPFAVALWAVSLVSAPRGISLLAAGLVASGLIIQFAAIPVVMTFATLTWRDANPSH